MPGSRRGGRDRGSSLGDDTPRRYCAVRQPPASEARAQHLLGTAADGRRRLSVPCNRYRELSVLQALKAGRSWASIGTDLGISRQAARQRFLYVEDDV